MVAWLVRKQKYLWAFVDFLAVVVAMLKWKKLINIWSVRFFNDLIANPEKLSELKYERQEL